GVPGGAALSSGIQVGGATWARAWAARRKVTPPAAAAASKAAGRGRADLRFVFMTDSSLGGGVLGRRCGGGDWLGEGGAEWGGGSDSARKNSRVGGVRAMGGADRTGVRRRVPRNPGTTAYFVVAGGAGAGFAGLAAGGFGDAVSSSSCW